MKVQVLGPGCMKCNKLFAETERAVAEVGVSVDLSKVERIDEIVKFGVMMTPALVIDGQVKCVGKVPSVAQIVEWLQAAKE
jgi:small redox-active disulfide protein 2